VEIPPYGTPSPSTAVPPQPAPPPPPGGRAPAGPGIVALRVLGGLVVATLVIFGTGTVVAGFFRQTRTETHEYAGPVSAVTVEARCGNTLVGLCQVGYDISVPPDMPLVLGTHTGTIDAVGLTGDVTATTHTGSVELHDLRSQRVEATTSTGSVEISFVTAPQTVTAETSTGSVDLALPGGQSYDVTASTSTGSNDVSVPTDPASGRHVRAHTSTGSVDVHPYSPGAHGSD